MKFLNISIALLGSLPLLSVAAPVANPEAELELDLEKRRSAQTCKIVNVNPGNYVNCRYQPSLKAGEIFGFPKGEKLTFACYKKGDCVNGVWGSTWDQITYLKTTCYVNGYYTDSNCPSSMLPPFFA
ncbi:putative MBL2-like secreted peptide [Aspergillus clavatus NRRL 1]|uniref:Mannose binding protein, putative n=1 Tax=Aspergillus clavatus (strain ATCC 1007 / CBS 513.65 / DSM 816 / NCTC 3887 / NRRL 1 / QM 1276 / 107) TaxID=344612 RepID=A1C5P9_ASPCL|nr:mannose binding protein, putative [Aspergillus clavatus NRRL 1]EAW15017.1 mannose binding protein, putative [Aspergillus clavatus NRRL 1]